MSVRHGRGAAVLPESPAPRLAQLDLLLPEKKSLHGSKEIRDGTRGPWKFALKTLPRLKYYNPALPIRVHTSEHPVLQLTFEGEDQNSLLSLEATDETTKPLVALFKSSWSDVTSKKQPPTTGASSQQQIPQTTLYTRDVKVDISGKPQSQIWDWFKHTAKSTDIPAAEGEELEMIERLKEFEVQSQIDRRLVRVGLDALKKEKEELRKAREAAERMTAEV